MAEEMVMAELAVNNINAIVGASGDSAEARFARRPHSWEPRAESDAVLQREVQLIRRQIDEVACSSTWAEDCLYRGVGYAPDFRCKCEACREFFPNRLHPRPVRESDYSADCQIESNEDPEFAEELAKLRNDRPRSGSIFFSRDTKSASHAHSRIIRSSGGKA
jgi:hypothetical protein